MRYGWSETETLVQGFDTYELSRRVYFIYDTDNTVIRSTGFIGNYCSDEVIPETIGQFTGLLDMNGTKIFEGDIVQDEFGFNRRVTWYKGRFTPFVMFPEYYCWEAENSKVVGNIIDHLYKIKEEN